MRRTILTAVILMPLMTACRTTPSANARVDRLNVGDRAPGLGRLRWITGPAVSNWTQGQVYVVDFWAPWCAPCHAAMPGLTRMQQERADTVRVIGIAIMPRLGMTPVKRFVATHPEMEYAVAEDTGGRLERSFWRRLRARTFPCAVVVDRAGRIRWMGNPHPNADQAALHAVVAQLVANEP